MQKNFKRKEEKTGPSSWAEPKENEKVALNSE